ncbi:MAG: hypothetical protein O2U62_00290 [Candidatus Bathyarchaeota archaeon]|nr:hypothetical protein [Candidatus Bathyarchaeota archaeon]
MTNHNTPYCGECCFLQDEDINGIGYCKLRCDSMRCGDQCELDHNRIGHDAVIYGLHYLQKWRRSNSDKLKMPPPYVVGKLIDAAIRKLRIYCV